jgi:hypothetical protein
VNPTKFLTELKRRNVYRAAVAYGVVAWFLTQLTTQVFPFFEIPNSVVRFVVIALAVEFPIRSFFDVRGAGETLATTRFGLVSGTLTFAALGRDRFWWRAMLARNRR